jgi:hypothetical protein
VLRRFAGGALHLLVTLVPDQYDRVAVGRELAGLDMHLGDERTSGVDRVQRALCRVGVNRGRDAVRREHDGLTLRDLGLLVDEDRAALLEVFHDMLVVHDLLAHVDGRPVQVECLLHRLHGAVDARAVSTRGREQDRARSAGHGPQFREGR